MGTEGKNKGGGCQGEKPKGTKASTSLESLPASVSPSCDSPHTGGPFPMPLCHEVRYPC